MKMVEWLEAEYLAGRRHGVHVYENGNIAITIADWPSVSAFYNFNDYVFHFSFGPVKIFRRIQTNLELMR